ncbi:MAG: transposase, partial [Bacteroidetes bacterium]|nr:transposase [Bacteroidota bacterium]
NILTFLYYHDVPPDNNGSERAIRNVKVKQKISGFFKSTNGAQTFAINRSIIDTIIKSRNNVLEGLNCLATYIPD